MKPFFPLLISALSLSLASNAQRRKPIVEPIPAYTAEMLMKRVQNPDTTYVVTFWATWCPRCMRELPEFETLHAKYKNTTVKVLMVSLDVTGDMKTKLPLFVKSNVGAEVVWLSDNDIDVYMPKIDTTWRGMLPATFIMSGSPRKKVFLERMVTAGEIIERIPE
jgi:thiol-disulfide isomerase/thioredoxin